MKTIEFDREVRMKLEAGVDKLNEAVGSTLGAKGRNVIFQKGKYYIATKDGVTVAEQVQLEDPIENAAAQIVKDAASRTARDAGDGTTTATVLASAIIKEAFRYVGSKANPMDLKRGIDLATTDVLKQIDNQKYHIKNNADLYNIARISSNNDEVIGKMIADIFEKVGENGAIRLEETQMSETVVDVVEGCQFNSGYLSPNFVNNQVKRTADYKDVAILITDKVFTESFDEIIPALELIINYSNENSKALPIVIICGGMEGEVLGTLINNKIKTKLPVVVVNAPEFGDGRTEILDDIAAITGGTVISENRGMSIKDIKLEDFGTAQRVVVDAITTTILGRNGNEDGINERIEIIKDQIAEDKDGYQTWRLEKRLATMSGGIGVIYVGGNSDVEMKDSYFRIEDALAATKAAMDDGYVAGGGVAYLKAAQMCDGFDRGSRDMGLGYEAVMNALKQPMRKIAENCGLEGSVVVNKVENGRGLNLGYDALTNTYGNMVRKGIIDPTKVVKTAIRNAASVAGMMITTNCVITDKPKK